MKCPNCQNNLRLGSDYCSRCGEDHQPDNTATLIAAHWAYVEGLLRAHLTAEQYISMVEYHYKSAWLHGVKHERERVKALPER